MQEGARYAAGQHEIGEGGTPHLQMMCIMSDKKSCRWMQQMFSGHIEFMHPNSTKELLRTYVTKEDTRDPIRSPEGPVIRGVWPVGQGARTDIESVMALIREGSSELDVANAFPKFWFRYYKACTKYRFLTQCDRSAPTHCTVYWGPSGTGKSTRAAEFGRSIVMVPSDGDGAGGLVESARLSQFWLARPEGPILWWDGYSNQHVVIIDEFYGWVKRDVCQRMIDRTPWQVPVKGDFVKFNSPFVVITSNLSPFDFWKNLGLGDAMKRRLSGDLGNVVYCGNEEYPTQSDYINSAKYALLKSRGHINAPLPMNPPAEAPMALRVPWDEGNPVGPWP